MTDDAGRMPTYTLRGIQSMLRISRTVLTQLIDAGFVSPSRGKRGEYRFTFQDVVLLRTAYGLQQAKIAPRRILSSLKRLKATLPDQVPLTGLRIFAAGGEIAVREGDAQWSVDTGQRLFDFEIRPSNGAVSLLAAAPATPSAQAWFERGVALESDDPDQAAQAYGRAIDAAPDYVDPYLNLAVMLCEAAQYAQAVELLRRAATHCAEDALVQFNLGVALEDLGRTREALRHYETSLRIAPDLADAHYNAARLCEALGEPSQAIRHYSAYRRLQRGG
jgi:tetratricopeptide (TPR) repeat protein